jgi:hypothetical protein
VLLLDLQTLIIRNTAAAIRRNGIKPRLIQYLAAQYLTARKQQPSRQITHAIFSGYRPPHAQPLSTQRRRWDHILMAEISFCCPSTAYMADKLNRLYKC